MPTIGAKVSQKELEAIQEYANQCGETISNLIRKIVIAEATMLNGGLVDEHPEYQCNLSIPCNISDKKEDAMLEEKINTIRRILGWREINLTLNSRSFGRDRIVSVVMMGVFPSDPVRL